jgi:hypothetical protein
MTKLEQVARLCAVVSRDAGGPYPETVDDPCGGLIDRDEALSAATIDNREAYARGVEDCKVILWKKHDEISKLRSGWPRDNEVIHYAMNIIEEGIKELNQRLEEMKNGK